MRIMFLLLMALPLASSPVSGMAQEPKKLPVPAPAVNPLISRIAFGSCSNQDDPMPILRTVLEWEPDLFIYLGDNIYGDTRDMRLLEAKYAKLGAKKDFLALRATTPTVATWDDHDYGDNDAGKEFPFRVESKEIFLKFWNEPNPSPRRDHDGRDAARGGRRRTGPATFGAVHERPGQPGARAQALPG